MEELSREFYDQSNFSYLKRVMERDGFKRCYPIRGIFNDEIGKFEIFDGIHRLAVAKDLGITKIPLEDETGILTKSQAIVEGIKANKTHAYYNPMDMARHLKTLGESLTSVRPHNSLGRPETVSLSKLAEQTGMSEKTISQYLQLLRLPEDVQKMVGQGKLKLSHAVILLRLIGTAYVSMIDQLAQDVQTMGLSKRELERRVEAIKKKGYFEEARICVGCKKVFPKDSISNPCLCPKCIAKLKSDEFAESADEERRKALRDYLLCRHLLEERYTKKGLQIPEKPQRFLEKLREEWKSTRKLSDSEDSNGSFTDWARGDE
jgi:ParB-like chromosome segregation protein Spo0J